MTAQARRNALIFLIIAAGLTILIGSGLSRLDFQPGMPLPSFENGEVVAQPFIQDAPLIGVPVSLLAKVLFFLFLAVTLGMMIYRLVKGVSWRQFFSEFGTYLFVIAVISAVISLGIFLLPKTEGSTYSEAPPLPAPPVTAPLGPVPSSLLWVIGILLAGLIIIVGVLLVRSKRSATLELWEREAERARQALLAGQDLKNVILRCYVRMSQALQQEQQLEREESMTTGEFEALLTSKGVPRDPVHQLTQLFEAARYGRWQPAPSDEQRALQSLEAILAYSHSTPATEVE